MMEDKKHRVSEIFYSIQGEGHYTGVPTAWVRFFGCNLECRGFGQEDPKDPSTYKLPFQEFDERSINRLEDLPVWEYGCDSSYSWAKKFAHLQHQLTSKEIVNRVREELKNKFNPEGSFLNPNSKQISHLCFTGGEPFLKGTQGAIIEILHVLFEELDTPESITIETNGTRELTDELINKFRWFSYKTGTEIFFSVSPKLFSVSGELSTKAIRPDVVSKYTRASPNGQLKFVMGEKEEQWNELDQIINSFRKEGVSWPVWIMPVGATLAGQHGEYGGHAKAGDVANMALERGYNVAARVHVDLWGNVIGV